ncbi:hypothetical protein GlitD10_2073 [Gloeomargarita lithophora Alchichica-D10]|uniref:DUF2358 domain-containing protein n=1 Tax=Gloeomargarita lithophora Alchichica-D10 TaxID=1188229 RepID=A0A1J0AEQ8_9CYAN|nr:DUF2358 domain-containing protein [Gloeomargarita lithophora]APB34400.1 hypothetical protein GlitD10_2073 [Gloeomargarita lithophora Alchichica-D10]
MDILSTLREDYARFPENQTYSIYAEDMTFADPMMRVQGRKQYQDMIHFLATWFQNIRLELHEMEQQGQVIHTRWTMGWTAPLPWRPRVTVTGRSELMVNETGQINRQIDYWDCSRWDLLRQHLPWGA